MQAPLCTEYVLDCAKTLAPLLSGRFGPLSDDASCNMLACYGVSGGNFPVHIDNHGNRDRRVLTLIYYMNPNYDAIRQGGCFVPWRITDRAPPKGEPPVMLSPGHLEPLAPIEPIADRLVAFWTCELPHSVQPFRAERGKIDGRYAITVWLTAEEGSEVFAQGQYFSKVLYTVPLNSKCTRALTFENWRKAATSCRRRKRTMHVPCKREGTGAWRKRRVDRNV
jgi:hypothetical protein